LQTVNGTIGEAVNYMLKNVSCWSKRKAENDS
jgi:hypothetical protein